MQIAGARHGPGEHGGVAGAAGGGDAGVVPRDAAQQPHRAARAQVRAQRGRGRAGRAAGAHTDAWFGDLVRHNACLAVLEML